MSNIPALRSFLRRPDSPLPLAHGVVQLIPSELHILPTGSTEDKPSLAWVLTSGWDPGQAVVVSQLSVRMLFESLKPDALEVLEKEWRRVKREKFMQEIKDA